MTKTKKSQSSKKEYPRQFFKNFEDLYKQKIGNLVILAKSHLYNQDVAIDVVHSAFEKSLVYKKKNPERNFREQVIRWLILKECKKRNKIYSNELPINPTRYETIDESSMDDYKVSYKPSSYIRH